MSCPYLSANRFSLLKELQQELQQEQGSPRSPRSPHSPRSQKNSPTSSKASTPQGVLPPTKTTRLTELAQACLRGNFSSLSLTETFNTHENEVVQLLLSLEKTLKTPQLAHKLLLQDTHALSPQTPSYLHIQTQAGSFTFWANIGYHEGSHNLEGFPTYGILITLGFSFQANYQSPSKKRTRLLNPRKNPRKKSIGK